MESTNWPQVKFAFIEGYDTFPPRRGTPDSAGMDVFLPIFNEVFLEDLKAQNGDLEIDMKEFAITVRPGQRVLLPTGLKLWIPKNSYIDVGTKSGTFKKSGLKTGSHVIDSDYQGQIYVSLFNSSSEDAAVHSGKAIAQLIHKPCIVQDWQFVTMDNLHTEVTHRSSGGFGSTGVEATPAVHSAASTAGANSMTRNIIPMGFNLDTIPPHLRKVSTAGIPTPPAPVKKVDNVNMEDELWEEGRDDIDWAKEARKII